MRKILKERFFNCESVQLLVQYLVSLNNWKHLYVVNRVERGSRYCLQKCDMSNEVSKSHFSALNHSFIIFLFVTNTLFLR